MFTITSKQILAPHVKRLDIVAPDIIGQVKPGQFVMVMAHEHSQKIPLTVVDFNLRNKTITLIFEENTEAARQLGVLPIGGNIFSILGPLGNPATIKKFGLVVCVSTGISTAQILPVCRALRKKENKVIGIIGANTKKDLMLEPQLRLACNKIIIRTDDGSYVKRGLATDALDEFIHSEVVNAVFAIGSVEMMKTVCRMTGRRDIKTFVTLKPLMIDGTGTCGSCRVEVAGKTILACVDGPEFDGHKVNFEELSIRMKAFEEMDTCCKHKSKLKKKKSALETVTRFVSGIPQSKQ